MICGTLTFAMTLMILDVYLAIKFKNRIPIILTFRPVAPWVASIGEHMFKCCYLFLSQFLRHLKVIKNNSNYNIMFVSVEKPDKFS